jgi:hypothetical protein
MYLSFFLIFVYIYSRTTLSTSMVDILRKHQIVDYYRYVYNILIVYEQKRNVTNMLEKVNTYNQNLNLHRKQTHNKINYLDLTIIKNKSKLNFEIYRIPTTIYLIFHDTSCHPYEHKIAAINYLYNQMNTYKITKENKKKS